MRTKYFEIVFPSDYTHWDLYITQPYEGNRAKLIFGFYKFFLSVNLWKTSEHKWDEERWAYGITFFERTVHLRFGKTKVVDLPWAWDLVRHDLLYPNGDVFYSNKYPIWYSLGKKDRAVTWLSVLDQKQPSEIQNKVAKFIDFEHTTKHGKVQKAKIRLTGEEREWRWKWFKWLPWPNIVRTTADCDSDTELGERAGSWKGGLMGWGINWNKKSETLEQAFERWYNAELKQLDYLK